MRRECRVLSVGVCAGLLLVATTTQALATDTGPNPWADNVVSYSPGISPDPGYSSDPNVVLGSPERFTGEFDLGGMYQAVVSPFNPAWGTDEILSIGGGGHLVVEFDEPITNDPSHLYGVDLIIFGNGGFADGDYPHGLVAGVLDDGPFTVSVSADNVNYVPLAGSFGDALFPALGYLDLHTPYDTLPGSVPTSFTKPVDPSLTFDDFLGLTFAEVLALYDGSGGGLPLDIGPTGLSEIRYVRIDVPDGAISPDFDAFVAVPEPGSALLLGAFCMVVLRRGC